MPGAAEYDNEDDKGNDDNSAKRVDGVDDPCRFLSEMSRWVVVQFTDERRQRVFVSSSAHTENSWPL